MDAIPQISLTEACRLVNQQIVPMLGTGLIAGEPELEQLDSGLMWRVPVKLSLPGLGLVGQIGTIAVDAQTGVLFVNNQEHEQLVKSANWLYQQATLSLI